MPSIDYREARARLSLAAVLELAGFESRGCWAGQLRGPCPVHKSRSVTSRVFAADVSKGLWHCFACGAGGNALDLWTALTGQPLHAAVLDLCARLNQEVPWLQQRPRRNPKERPMPEP